MFIQLVIFHHQDAFFETHMMVQRPEQWIENMADAGVNLYTYHIEPVLDQVDEICRKVRESGMKVGLAIKPGTDLKEVVKYIPVADMILIMTVEPGFGGQKFMADQMSKVKWLRENYPSLDIEVDGGVGLNTIHQCAKVWRVYVIKLNLFIIIKPENSRVKAYATIQIITSIIYQLNVQFIFII